MTSSNAFSFIFGSVLLFNITFWFLVLILKKVKWFEKFSLDERSFEYKHWNRSVKLALTNSLLVLPICLFFTYPIVSYLGIKFNWHNPSLLNFLLELIFYMFCEDILFFWTHKALHGKWAFKKIHKVHHEIRYPSAISAIHTHWIEFILGNLVPLMSGPILLAILNYKTSLYMIWIWTFIRTIETILAHSSFHYPIKVLSFFSGPKNHYIHHEKNSGHYGSFFNFWDNMHQQKDLAKKTY